MIGLPIKFLARIYLYSLGVLYLNHKKVRYDYSKYLGKDWKLTFDRPSTIV
jgi:hypothetical protein